MKRQRVLSITPTADEQPTDRGRLMTAEEVAAELFRGNVHPQWVRRNIRPKVRLGHSTVRFFEADVRDWIEQRRLGGAPE